MLESRPSPEIGNRFAALWMNLAYGVAGILWFVCQKQRIIIFNGAAKRMYGHRAGVWDQP